MAVDQHSADQVPAAQDASTEESAQLGFGSEFRELARQRRFQREEEAASVPATRSRTRTRRAKAAARPAAAVVEAPPPAPAIASAPAPSEAQPTTDWSFSHPPAQAPRAPRQSRTYADRLSHSPYEALTELSRMADRMVEAREQLATERARAQRAERELQASHERIMAARALVHEAQRTARAAAERCAFLEGRCESLSEALDLALNASLMQRWRWRRRANRTAS